MRPEQLSKAARAAGFAMAFSDDLLTTTSDRKKAEGNVWSSGAVKLLDEAKADAAAERSPWRKGVYSWFGWSATA